MKWLFLVSIGVVALASCRKSAQPPVVGGPSLADSAEQILFEVHSMLTDHGVKRGDMYADTVYVFNDQTKFVMRRVRATFNTTLGAPNGTLRGDRGTYDLRAQVLEGYGNVVVTSTEGRRLTSNHLKFTQTTNMISSDSAFTFCPHCASVLKEALHHAALFLIVHLPHLLFTILRDQCFIPRQHLFNLNRVIRR